VHVITELNSGEAQDAVRDILMMFADMAASYAGLGHASNVYIRFDPLKFVDVIDDERAFYVDIDLLRSGSAVAILCEFYDLWCEEQSLAGHARTTRFEVALNEGRFGAFPDIEHVLRTAVARNVLPLDDPWFEEAVLPIYRRYVLGLFARLAAQDRHAGDAG
jgi:hypothetical protein